MAAAAALALVPMSPSTVDRIYSRGIYILFQPIVTSISSVVPFAVLDLLAVGACLWLGLRVFRVVRATPHRGRAVLALVADLAVVAAAAYVIFLAMWGLNYRRLPITAGLDFDAARVTPHAVEAFAHRAVDEVNASYASAHADLSAIDTLAAVRVRLIPAFTAAQRALGATRLATGGRPKWSLLALFFRWASVDGMVNPFGLDVILNPDVLPVERPFVLAHEWGHLAGWARESEASYVGWLTCLDGDAAARYSGWLSVYMTLRGAVPRRQPVGARPRPGGGPARGPRCRRAPSLARTALRPHGELADVRPVPEGQSGPERPGQLRRGRDAAGRHGGRPFRSARPSLIVNRQSSIVQSAIWSVLSAALASRSPAAAARPPPSMRSGESRHQHFVL